MRRAACKQIQDFSGKHRALDVHAIADDQKRPSTAELAMRKMVFTGATIVKSMPNVEANCSAKLACLVGLVLLSCNIEVDDLRTQNSRLQTMLKHENETSQHYWDRLQVYVQAGANRTGKDLLPAFGGMDGNPMVDSLETEITQQLKIHDMVEEANEYMKENLRLKDEMCETTMNVHSAQSDKDIKKGRSELLAERN
eukprot:s2746_g7.t1